MSALTHSHCPVCRGNPEGTDSPEPYQFLTRGRTITTADGLSQDMCCTDCGATWTNTYRYVGPVNVERDPEDATVGGPIWRRRA